MNRKVSGLARTMARAALMSACVMAAGCGTVSNLARSCPEKGGRTPFGGVRQDVACLNRAMNGEAEANAVAKPEAESHPQQAIVVLCALDLPFSLLGDVVTWPYTAAYTFINRPAPTPPLLMEAAAEGTPHVAATKPVTAPKKRP